MASIPQLVDLDFQGTGRVVGLADPSNPTDAANKRYVDSAIEGISWKRSVRVSTQANINLASPGATIDGITMALNDRVLVRSQSIASQNGIYVWNGASAAMVRSDDASTFDELEQAAVSVQEGTSADVSFRQTEVNGTLGSSNVVFESFGTSAPPASTTQAGVVELATQGEVDTGTDTQRAVTPETLANSVWAAKRYGQTFGDGSATSYVINHNLNTLDVDVTIYETGGSQRMVGAEVRRTSTTAVTLLFNVAPALNSLRVVVTA